MARSGLDIILTFDDGASITLVNFFTENMDSTATFRLRDGDEISGTDLIFDGDGLCTSMQPYLSGSSGVYSASAGTLIAGVEALEHLGALPGQARPGQGIAAGPYSQASGTGGDSGEWLPGPGPNPGPNPGPDPNPDPNPGPKPVPGPDYSARAVFYHDGRVAEQVLFRVLDADGRPIQDPSSSLVSLNSNNGYFDLDSLVRNPDGTFSISLSEAGRLALSQDASGGNLYDYLTIMVDGREYTMQVIINQNGQYDSGRENDLNPPAGDIHGEWHSGGSGTPAGDRQTGNGHDEIWLEGGALSGLGGFLDIGAGNDTVTVHSDATAMDQARLVSGSGNNLFTISGGQAAMAGSSISTGNGDDTITLDGDVISGSSITSAGGNNVIVINGQLSTSELATGNGDDYLRIDGSVSESSIDAGTGNNQVSIRDVVGQGEATGVSNSTIGGGGSTNLTIQASTESGYSYGLEANASGSSTSGIDVSGDVLITANAGGSMQTQSHGIYSGSGAQVTVRAANIGIASGSLEYGPESANAYGVRSVGGNTHLSTNNSGGSINITAMGGDYASALHTTGGGRTTIEYAGAVSITGQTGGSTAYGMRTTGSETVIRNVDDLTIAAQGGDQATYGIFTNSGGKSVFQDIGSMDVTARAGGSVSPTAVMAWTGENEFKDIDRLSISTTNTEDYNQAFGVWAYAGGKNTFDVGDLNLQVNASGYNQVDDPQRANVYGMVAQGAGSENTVIADKLVMNVHTDYGSGYAFNAQDGGKNVITSKGPLDVEINVSNWRQFSPDALYATGAGSSNAIIGGQMDGAGDRIAIDGAVRSIKGGQNSIVTGNGDDTISLGKVAAGETGGTQNGGKNSINTGAGDDRLHINSMIASDGGINEISFHGGNNTVTLNGDIWSMRANSQNIFRNTDTESGFYLDLSSGYRTGYGLWASDKAENRIETLAVGQDDNIRIDMDLLTTSGGLNAIHTRGGEDTVTIDGEIRVRDGASLNIITTGGAEGGDDYLRLTVRDGIYATQAGTNRFQTFEGDDHTRGTGNDTLNITANFHAEASATNRIETGTGNDLVVIDGNLNAYSGTNAIYTHEGDDQVIIQGDINSITQPINGTGTATNIIDTGSGDDTVTVYGNITAAARNKSVVISTGEGDDQVHLHKDVTARDSGNVSISLGSGDDALYLYGTSTASGGTITYDLGSGDDHLYLLGDSYQGVTFRGGTGVDTLHFGREQGASLSLDEFINVKGNSLNGFEILDMTDGSGNDILDLDVLLSGLGIDAKLENGRFQGASSLHGELQNGTVLRVHGDAGDTVHVSGNGWSESRGTVQYDGFSYEVYQSEANSAEYVLIQSGLLVA